MPFIRSICIQKLWDAFSCFLFVFIILKLINFKKISAYFLTLLFLFFFDYWYRAVLWTGPISFLVNCRFFVQFYFYLTLF